MLIRCITLDLDNTLWDVTPTMIRAEKQTYAWAQREAPPVAELLADRAGLIALRDELIGGSPVLAVDLGRLRRELYRRLVVRAGYGGGQGEDLAGRLFAVHRKWRNTVELFEGVLDGLKRLSRRGLKVGAITNGNADLAEIGLMAHFDFAVSAAMVGVAKPEAAIFRAAGERAQVAADRIVHMGDSAETDVEGARGAGMHAIWFNPQRQAWPLETPEPVQIAHWSELPAALERL